MTGVCALGTEARSEFAPRIITVRVPVDKIGEVIGPKGKMINQIPDDTGADISIEDDGTVFISLSPGKDGLLHISQIRKLVGGKRVENVEDVLAVGQKVQVQIGEIDPRGKLSLEVVEDNNAEAVDDDSDDE